MRNLNTDPESTVFQNHKNRLQDNGLSFSTVWFPDSKPDSTIGMDTDVPLTWTGAYSLTNFTCVTYAARLTSNQPLPPLPNHSHASREFPLAGTLPAPASELAE